MKFHKTVIITDLDNTLFDWVHLWHACFSSMLEKMVEISGLNEASLKKEIRKIHQLRRTSEYSFLIEELPTLQERYRGQDLKSVFSTALLAYREQRRKELRLYPFVAESLLKIKGSGAKIIGYTESMAFYSSYRIRRLGLDGIFDIVFSPKDHDLPEGLTAEETRKYPADRYNFRFTKHEYTPPNELKPNKDILLSIIDHIGATPEDCVYVGDSLFKDVAMARDAGVLDAWAKYGQSQNTQAYQLLREVTHWSDADVEREKKITEREVKPSLELPSYFSDLFDFVKFGNNQSFYDLVGQRPTAIDDKKLVVEIWKTVVDVQKHFNDISLRIRGIFVTLVLALSAAMGFLAEKGLKFSLGELSFHYAILIPIAGIVGTLLFYFMDRYSYHRLLVGSVNQGLHIEHKYRMEIPELTITNAIGQNSPVKLKRRTTQLLAWLVVTDPSYHNSGNIHSTGKIELIYKPIVWLFVIVFFGAILGGGLTIKGLSILELCFQRFS